jgi:hypothetical protein
LTNVPVRFVSEPIAPLGGFEPGTIALGEPGLPPAFTWHDAVLTVGPLRRTWRGTKVDRGDTYVKRHYFEFETSDDRVAVVYFERQARRGEARWHLYTIEER